ncbi:F510_1955 family glycosylhydrolase [Effusibacillus dendaii]|uniref:Sortilin N-terminal domain-containing protein n=1 Tax=Effusibacillus dendaii TaxID=2743772 RepID=A0A7I8DDT7_9BACL|nr:glycosyl hydrolase [Effusibacillus dendaii]BCJ88358.1 hypothetical protein skT53_33430 [Effusibacillus dendaii]
MQKSRRVFHLFTAMLLGGAILLAGCGTSSTNTGNNAAAGNNTGTGSGGDMTLQDIHGLAFSSDGKQLWVPSHDGIKIYENGQWKQAEGPKNDYMGFSIVDKGFYSSGHPGTRSDLKNPLGIVKSTDDGKTVETLGMSGESDFHVMSVGYQTHAIYVDNEHPNSKMKGSGLFYSKDEAKTWTQSEAQGATGTLTSMAVHPAKESVVALGTDKGVYLSKDYGQTFEQILSDVQVTTLYFNKQGNLYVGGTKTKAVLLLLNPDTKQTTEINIPELNNDAVAYVAENQKNEQQIAFATYNKNVYTSSDAGKSWTKIANLGKTVSK